MSRIMQIPPDEYNLNRADNVNQGEKSARKDLGREIAI